MEDTEHNPPLQPLEEFPGESEPTEENNETSVEMENIDGSEPSSLDSSTSGVPNTGTKSSRMRARINRGIGTALNPFNVGIQKLKGIGDDGIQRLKVMSDDLVKFTNDDKWEDFQDDTGEGIEPQTTYVESNFKMSPDGLTGEWQSDATPTHAQQESSMRHRKTPKNSTSNTNTLHAIKIDTDKEGKSSDGDEEETGDLEPSPVEEGGLTGDSARDQVHRFMQKRKQHWLTAWAMWDNWSALYLVMIGILTAVVGSSMDYGIFQLQKSHYKFMNLVDNVYGKFFLWLGYYIMCFYFAITLTLRVAPQAAGSGVPELKSIMSGIHLKRVLSFRVLLVKIFGLVAALGSGAFLGKEGPFIHLSATLATQFAKLPLFQRIRRSEHLMQIMLGAACATGVASHFGSPVGGVLFSIEITTAYYPTRNYWTAYIGAVTGGTCFRYLWNTIFREPGFKPLVPTKYENTVYFGVVEICVFILLGVATGVLGVGFIKIYSFIARTWKKICLKYNYVRSPYVYSLIVAIATGIITFPPLLGNFISLAPLKGLSDLVSHLPLDDKSGSLAAEDWTNRNLYLNLFLFMASRYLITPLSIIMPVPCGLFVPILTIGASVGRIFGEAAVDLLKPSWLYEKSLMYAGSYAIAGAAGFTASVTQTLSAAVIVFEITGSIVHLIPTLVTVMISMAVSKRFRMGSIYDCISILKGLPFLPDLKKETYSLKAGDIMIKDTHYITKQFEVEDIKKKLAESNLTMFPVVNNDKQMLLIGTVNRDQLEKALADLEKKPQISPELAAIMAQELGHVVAEQKKRLDHLIIHSTPIRFLEATPLTQIHLLFITLRLTNAFVTTNGQLKGAITRQVLREAIIKLDNLVFT